MVSFLHAIPRTRCLLAPALLTASIAAHAADKVMTWLMPDFPPAAIPVDGKPGNGIADNMVKYVAAHWPGVEHRFVYANAKRTWVMLESGEQACFAAALRTPEREKIAYFVNAGLATPHEVIARADQVAALPRNAEGEVELPALLANPALKGLLVEKRSYAPLIDRMLSEAPPVSGILRTTLGDYGKNVFRMVSIGRVDYTIDYDFTFAYIIAKSPDLTNLKALPIAGNSKPAIAGFACPRNEWGKAAARKIDGIIGTREGAEAMAKAIDAWLSDDTRRRYAHDIADFVHTRSKPSDPRLMQ